MCVCVGIDEKMCPRSVPRLGTARYSAAAINHVAVVAGVGKPPVCGLRSLSRWAHPRKRRGLIAADSYTTSDMRFFFFNGDMLSLLNKDEGGEGGEGREGVTCEGLSHSTYPVTCSSINWFFFPSQRK